jgi:hypothetical protein
MYSSVLDDLGLDPHPYHREGLAPSTPSPESPRRSIDTSSCRFPRKFRSASRAPSRLRDLAAEAAAEPYIGRILRTTDTKTDVEVHDYLDPGPVFRKMYSKRVATHTTLRFDVPARP